MRMPAAFLLLAALCSPLSRAQTAPPLDAKGPVPDYLAEQPVRSLHAMVVSIHHLATDAGVATLKRGGNAVDAAVAVGFTLAVVYPDAGNLGGGGFMLVHLSGENGSHARVPAHDTFIDFREEAPGAATPGMYLDARGNVIPDASILGPKAIGVPGTVAGLAYAEKKYGRLGLKKVMEPAITLAEHGWVLTPPEAGMLNDKHLRDYPATRAIFGAQSWAAGETFRQPELATTLQRIAEDPDGFYRGAMAQQLAAGMARIGALITASDLAAYHAMEREPIRGRFDGQTVLSAPPPSSGGVTLLETLNILDAPPAIPLQTMGDRSPQWIASIVEAFRRAYLDRNAYLGDPAYVKMPIDAMLSPAYAEAWRATMRPGEIVPSAQLTRPAGFLPPPPTMGEMPGAEKPQTTHFSVMDAEGNAVAVTTTLNGSFGSYETAPGLGFLLNDEMDDFTSKQGVPNMFGLVQGPANAIEPGKRPLSSMTPTIVLARDGSVHLVLGSPGGSRIISTVVNILLSVDDGGLNVQSAVDAPRFHHQNLPDTLFVEPDFAVSIVDTLRSMGYHVQVSEHAWSDGECIARDPATGVLTGGHDHRHAFGSARGY